MKRILTAAVVVASFLSAPVLAQSNAGAASQSASAAKSQSASLAGASSNNSVYIDQRAPASSSSKQTVRTEQSGTTKIANVASLGSLALGGGHPCQWTPASAQLSIVGGAGGFGAGKVDEACMLMLLAAQGYAGASQATVHMIAARDRDACTAMYKAGMVTDCKDKRGKSYVKAEPVPVVSTRSASAPKVPFSVECRRSGNSVTPVASRKVYDAYGKSAVMNACR